MNKKLTLAIAAILVLGVAAYFLFLRDGGEKIDFKYEKVTTGDITAYVTATGTINPVVSVDVGTQVSGIIAKLYADFNSVVKAGQVIAKIDTTFLVQTVNDAQASLEKARVQTEDSKRNYEREKTLYDKGLESEVNYQTARTTYESNAATLKSVQATLDRAKINLAYATIYAPIDGVVINRMVNVGQTVAASFSSPTLYTIANDLSKMQVLTTVDESDIGRISIGQEASFTVDAYATETFKGRISQIRLSPVSIQNVVNYTVVIDVDNDKLKLMPGMTANVKILVASAHNVLRVPNMALRFQPPGDLVDSTRLRALREAAGSRKEIASTLPPAGANSRDASRDPGPADARREGDRRDADPGSAAPRPLRVQRTYGADKPMQYTIDVRYPEYQKSSYDPKEQSGRARLWIYDESKKTLEPLFVKTGITDGKYTEVQGRELKEGDRIVMGINSNGGTPAAKNPLTGGGQQRPGGPR